jgi:alkylated DNA nucleotide flippase Atl1
VAEPKNPTLPKMREWPMFRAAQKRAHRAKSSALDGRPLPRIADLVMEHVPGSATQKLAWLRELIAAGKLDGDAREEIEQAEALLTMLSRFSGSSKEKRHVDELLDEGLKETFPASDPVSVGHFTSTEAPSRPLATAVVDYPARKARGRKTQTRRRVA